MIVEFYPDINIFRLLKIIFYLKKLANRKRVAHQILEWFLMSIDRLLGWTLKMACSITISICVEALKVQSIDKLMSILGLVFYTLLLAIEYKTGQNVLKKSRSKKLVKWNESISQNFIFFAWNWNLNFSWKIFGEIDF